MPKQSPTPSTPDNMGVGGDVKPITEEYPRGELTHDEQHHHNGIDSQFVPLVNVK